MAANQTMTLIQNIKSSFRDPDSQVFVKDGILYRHIREPAVPHYQALMQSGLYKKLVALGLLISHNDVTHVFKQQPDCKASDIFIRPQIVPFISYPYEWSFSALKAAALATLKIQKLSLDYGMTLQDATAFNIQFYQGEWLLIDTSSFRIQQKMHPWGAYRQFCQHFLAPLLLMSYCDGRLSALMMRYPDGIPLDLAVLLLPMRAKCRLPIFIHLLCHSRFVQKDFNIDAVEQQKKEITSAAAYGMLDQLTTLICSLEIKKRGSIWTDYETTHTYDSREFRDKEMFILNCANRIDVNSVWDLGANTGHFSRLLSAHYKKPISIVAFDNDFLTVETGYRKSSDIRQNRPLHLLMDILNPTPSLGWAGEEWQSLEGRGPADLVLALALIHHICLSGNIGIPQVFDYFKNICRYLIIEFVPKSDPQSQRLLKSRKDIHPDYAQDQFEKAMTRHFTILDTQTVSKTGRLLYFLQRTMNNHE